MKTPKGTELKFINLQGKDYLPVNQRLIWFREEHPDWRIYTELVERGPESSLVKATIANDSGTTMAMAHKFDDHEDHTERAETGAIGRALALCGFGTQFAGPELDEGDRIADAPVERSPKPTLPTNSKKTQERPSEHPIFQDDPSVQPKSDVTIPFGKNKGRLISELTDKQLDWYLENERKKVGGKFGPDKELISAIEWEIHCRSNPAIESPRELFDQAFGAPPKINQDEELPF